MATEAPQWEGGEYRPTNRGETLPIDIDEIAMRWASQWNESDDGEVRAWRSDIAALIDALRDLRMAVELMDTKVTPHGERADGTTMAYIVADSTWHRVLAVARGSTSDAARAAIDAFKAGTDGLRASNGD